MPSKRLLIVVLLIPLLIAGAALLFGLSRVNAMPPVYSSSTSIVFSPKPTDSGLVPGSETIVLTANNALSLITTPETKSAVSRASGIPLAELDNATEATVIPGRTTMVVTVTSTTREEASRATAKYAEVVEGAFKRNSIATAKQVGSPSSPLEPSGPPRKLLVVVVGGLALVLGLCAFAVLVVVARILSSGGFSRRVATWLAPQEPQELGSADHVHRSPGVEPSGAAGDRRL